MKHFLLDSIDGQIWALQICFVTLVHENTNLLPFTQLLKEQTFQDAPKAERENKNNKERGKEERKKKERELKIIFGPYCKSYGPSNFNDLAIGNSELGLYDHILLECFVS